MTIRIGSRVSEYLGWDEEEQRSLLGDSGIVIAIRDCDDESELYTVRCDDGRIVVLDYVEDITPLHYANIYLHDRAYGGPEEGGWWYDTRVPENGACDLPTGHFPTPEAAEEAAKALQEWCDEQNGKRRSDISSVISEGRFEVILEAWPAEPKPSRRPHYC